MLFDAGLVAWATLVLAILAAGAAVYAWRAWGAQAAQVRMLSEQLAADRALTDQQLPLLEGQRRELEASRRLREREEQERREAYVSRVFIWQELRPGGAGGQAAGGAAGGRESWICARSVADVPVYDVGFAWRAGGDVVSFARLGAPLMPGPQEAALSWVVTAGVAPEDIEIAVFLRDVNWNRWRILADGRRQPFTEDMLPAGTW